MLSALIQSDEGVNAVWVFLKSLEQAMQTLSSKESNDVADLRDSLSGANDYTDKAVNKLYTYVDAMNGGVGGLIDSTSYDPSGLPTDKPCTLIALGSGTFTNLKDVNNTAITVSQSNSITVFFRAAHITYWNYKTEVLTAPPMDDTPTNGNTTHVVSSDGVYDFVMAHGIDNVDVADVTGSDYLKDRIVYSMRKNMGTVSEPDYEIIAEFTIPIATATKAGLMPAYIDGVFDVNRYVGSNTPYDSLSQVLNNAATLIPTAVRRGGMSIKFIQSSDNKYVQYRYMGNSIANADFTNTDNWQGVDDEPTAGSNNLVKSGGIMPKVSALIAEPLVNNKLYIPGDFVAYNGTILKNISPSIGYYTASKWSNATATDVIDTLYLPKIVPGGKNILDPRFLSSGIQFNSADGTFAGNSNYKSYVCLPVNGGETITLSLNYGAGYWVEYDSNRNVIKTTQKASGVNTLTLDSNTAFISFSIASNDSNVILTYSSTTVPYEDFYPVVDKSWIPRTDDVVAILNRLGIVEDNNVLRLSLTSGKNLFDKSKGFYQGFLYATSAIDFNTKPYISGTYCNTPPIPVQGGEKVTLSSTAQLNNVFNVQYDANGNVLTGTASDDAHKTIQLHEDAAYIRCSLKYSESANFQVEYGTASTEYEEYRVVVAEEGLTPTVEDIVNKKYKIASFKDYPIGRNLYNKANVRNNPLYSATAPMSDGIPYISGTYCSTNLIPVFGGRDVIVNYNGTTNSTYTIAYDVDGNIVLALQNTAANAKFKLPETAAWLRVSFKYSDNDVLQIEYGTVSTGYESYIGGSFIDYTQLYSKWVNDIVSKQVDAEFICPSRLYAMAGKNNLLYYRQMIIGDCNVPVSLSQTSLLRLYKEYIRVYDAAAKNITTTISTRGTMYQGRTAVACKNVVAPASEKTIKILPIGDSMTDLGYYETWLKEYLGDDNVNVEYIGSKGNPPIIYEALSGGNLSWITADKGAAYIVEVSNMDAYPHTGYGPVTYKDSNNVVWECKGAKLTLSEGKYSGKLKFAIFNSDGTPVDHAVIPASGILTKANSKAGDATISYSNAVEVNYNPFWNINDSVIDIDNYLAKWGFDTPDVILMQFGYNEGMSDSAMLRYAITATSRAKAFIDSVHQQLPNCKIIFGVEPYGAEVSHVFGQGAIGTKKDFMNQFMKQMIATFDNATYSFVYLVPTYGKMSTTYGYGALIQQNFSVYQDANITTLQQGLDGVHPPYDYGAKEMALGYEPVVVEIANSL